MTVSSSARAGALAACFAVAVAACSSASDSTDATGDLPAADPTDDQAAEEPIDEPTAAGDDPQTPDAAADDGAAEEQPGDVIVVGVLGGVVSGGGRHAVDLGSEVTLEVTSDAPEEVHVHGYDVFAELVPDSTTQISFTADLPGVWEVELEDSGVLLFELEVS